MSARKRTRAAEDSEEELVSLPEDGESEEEYVLRHFSLLSDCRIRWLDGQLVSRVLFNAFSFSAMSLRASDELLWSSITLSWRYSGVSCRRRL
jgi:hypothetical protein